MKHIYPSNSLKNSVFKERVKDYKGDVIIDFENHKPSDFGLRAGVTPNKNQLRKLPSIRVREEKIPSIEGEKLTNIARELNINLDFLIPTKRAVSTTLPNKVDMAALTPDEAEQISEAIKQLQFDTKKRHNEAKKVMEEISELTKANESDKTALDKEKEESEKAWASFRAEKQAWADKEELDSKLEAREKACLEYEKKLSEHSKLLDEKRDELSFENQKVINNLMDEMQQLKEQNKLTVTEVMSQNTDLDVQQLAQSNNDSATQKTKAQQLAHLDESFVNPFINLQQHSQLRDNYYSPETNLQRRAHAVMNDDYPEVINTATIETNRSQRFDTIKLKSLSLSDIDEYCDTLICLKKAANLDEASIIIISLLRSDQTSILNELNRSEKTNIDAFVKYLKKSYATDYMIRRKALESSM